jgi:hypothetical protein
MEIVFEGGEADEHAIEAYTGTESLNGIARAAVLVAHYVDTGEVRFRSPYSEQLRFYIGAPEEGSLEFPVKLVCKAAEAVAAQRKKLAIALLTVLLARATGQATGGELVVDQQTVSSGDIDALAEAATAGLTRAHRWITQSGKKVQIRVNSAQFVELNEETKAYLETEELGDTNTIDVSVAALNANSKIGRVYFSGLGRTIPFKVAREASARTVSNLSAYLSQYVNKTGATVNIQYRPIYYPDGRLKRILIFDCFPIAGLE